MSADQHSSIDQKITLSDLIDRELVRDIVQKFSNFTEIKAKITAENGDPYINVGELPRICSYASQKEKLKKLCDDTVTEASWAPIKENEPFFFTCACGLNYEVVSISSQFDHLGRLIIGPFRTPDTRISEKFKTELDMGTQLNYAIEKIPLKTKEEADRIARFLGDIMDIFIFLSIKRLLTSRLHLDSIFRARDEIITQMENELVKPEDREELERLKHIF